MNKIIKIIKSILAHNIDNERIYLVPLDSENSFIDVNYPVTQGNADSIFRIKNSNPNLKQ